MSFNLLISSSLLKVHFLNHNKIYLFLSYVDIDTEQVFKLRLLFKNKNLVFKRLNTKQINRIISSTTLNNVVLKINNKNYLFNSFNLSMLILNDFFTFINILIYFLTNYRSKVFILSIKINNFIFNDQLLYHLFENFFINSYNFKDLNFSRITTLTNTLCFRVISQIKIRFYKTYYFIKILLLLKIYYDLYKILIK